MTYLLVIRLVTILRSLQKIVKGTAINLIFDARLEVLNAIGIHSMLTKHDLNKAIAGSELFTGIFKMIHNGNVTQCYDEFWLL